MFNPYGGYTDPLVGFGANMLNLTPQAPGLPRMPGLPGAGQGGMMGGGNLLGFLQQQGVFDKPTDPSFIGPQLPQQQPSQQPQGQGLLGGLQSSGLLGNQQTGGAARKGLLGLALGFL